MEWWTHLWLNEGFVIWVSYLPADNLFPKWKIWTQFLDQTTDGLRLDGLAESHPIEVKLLQPLHSYVDLCVSGLIDQLTSNASVDLNLYVLGSHKPCFCGFEFVRFRLTQSVIEKVPLLSGCYKAILALNHKSSDFFKNSILFLVMIISCRNEWLLLCIQRSLASYIKKFAFSNARTEDLWATLEEGSEEPVNK